MNERDQIIKAENDNNEFLFIYNQHAVPAFPVLPYGPSLQSQQDDEDEKKPSGNKNEKYFPYRLWDLVNDNRYDDVIRWSYDGNCIVFEDQEEFVERVLRLKRERFFKTESFVSFVRQLNLYGFRKVQLDKDPRFAKDIYKHCWKVFEHKYFKRCHHALLGKVRRRMNVKKKTEAENVNPEGGFEPIDQSNNPFENENEYFGELTGALHDEQSIHYANFLPQLDHCVDRKHAKRRLFGEEKEEKRTSPLQVVPQHTTPYVFLPQALLNPTTYPSIFCYPPPLNVPYGGSYMTSNNLYQTNTTTNGQDFQRKVPNLNDMNNVFGNEAMKDAMQEFCASIYSGQ